MTEDERVVLGVLKHTYLHHEPGATLPDAWLDALRTMDQGPLLRALGGHLVMTQIAGDSVSTSWLFATGEITVTVGQVAP